jgi:hypothetical protein
MPYRLRIHVVTRSVSFLAKTRQSASSSSCESAYVRIFNAGATSIWSLVEPTPLISLRAEYIFGPVYTCYSLPVGAILETPYRGQI